MHREFMVPFAWALTVVGMICVSANKNSGERKPEARPVTVTVDSPSDGPTNPDIGIGDSVVWANNARMKYAANLDDDGRTLEAGEF